jgi:hypothetical protein
MGRMRERAFGELLCHVRLGIELMGPAVGPVGDTLFVALRITGGVVTGLGPDKDVLGGVDFALVYADGKLVHSGKFVAGAPAGIMLFWYSGTSTAGEDAYDRLLDRRLPARSRSELVVHVASTDTEWSSLNRRPLTGIGTIDPLASELQFVLRTLGL